MKFTLSWLKDHLETDASLEDIAKRLTMLGLEVERISDRAQGLEGFVVGEVTNAEKHPDADKLQVCTVNTGTATMQVVCGAPNARTGMKGVFAAEGAYIPGIDVTLKKAKIRGVESSGMLLSEREMGLSDEHDGIIDLPENAVVGASAVETMGLNDVVIEIAITPNRGDCLGVRGIARDLAASGMGHLKAMSTDPVPGAFKSPISVSIENESACPQFVGRMVRGITNQQSPKWMRDRLLAIDLRPISALVDITNYVTFDLGRPLHVFDADKVKGNIVAKLASNGEKFLALDGKEYELDDDICTIADDNGPEALGGVMGGEASGCTESTTSVFIESAIFDPIRTAATGRKLNIISDARFRFERSVDQAFAAPGIEIATRLVLEICGGEPSEITSAGVEPKWQRDIKFRPDRVKELIGVKVERDEMVRILSVLGFGVSGDGDEWTVAIPSWRADIVAEPCIVEEIIRVYGYDRIPAVSLPRDGALPKPALTPEQALRSNIRRALAARGMVEAITYSFMPSGDADLFGVVTDEVRLVNPISSDLDVMRPSILPNLLAAIGRNDARGFSDGKLFEIGPQFSGDDSNDQELVASGVRSGAATPRNWQGDTRTVDAFDAKADAMAVIAAFGIDVGKAQITNNAPSWYHPGRSGSIQLGPKNVLAHFGEIHPEVLKKMNIKGPATGFEVQLSALPKPKAKKSQHRAMLRLSALQPVERDFAFVVDVSIPAADVARAAATADKKLISGARVFDLFEGKSVGEGKKSLAVEITLQPVEKTLTDEEIEAIGKKIVIAVEKATGGVLRS